ncbi:MAG: hypothetical protein L0H73_17530, partial [Nitrococcus sp.]|nr:hypothetical protein [Nitrococcus sp.]
MQRLNGADDEHVQPLPNSARGVAITPTALATNNVAERRAPACRQGRRHGRGQTLAQEAEQARRAGLARVTDH